jgi:hypothetical protein
MIKLINFISNISFIIFIYLYYIIKVENLIIAIGIFISALIAIITTIMRIKGGNHNDNKQ